MSRTDIVTGDHLQALAAQGSIEETEAHEGPKGRAARQVVEEGDRGDDGMLQAGLLQGGLDLGFGLKVRDAARRSGVRDGGEHHVGDTDGLGGFDKVVALLVLVDTLLAGHDGHYGSLATR